MMLQLYSPIDNGGSPIGERGADPFGVSDIGPATFYPVDLPIQPNNAPGYVPINTPITPVLNPSNTTPQTTTAPTSATVTTPTTGGLSDIINQHPLAILAAIGAIALVVLAKD